MKISELLDNIRNLDLVLPEFQREYVWTRDQAKQLMTSLVKEYPVGSLLFWKTDRPPELKNVNALPDKLGTIQVILDGQQRLTTLYMLITGNIPHYYTEADLQNDPRDLYYNLDTGEFRYYQATMMKDNPLWQQVVACFNQQIDVFKIAHERASTEEASAFTLAQRYMDCLTRLRNLKERDLPVQVVPPSATLDDAIDIFDLVNSQGTKLTDAELALTHVTGKWAQARRVMKKKIEELSKYNFYFDLTFMTRALTGVVTRRALFEQIHSVPREDLVQGWQELERILDYLVSVLPERAYIHSTEDLNSTNTLIPLIVYLSLHQRKFPNEKAFKNAIHWLYAAHTWSRYTAQTDQRLEQDLTLVVREDSPWDALRDQIIDQRGRIEVKATDLEGRGIQHPLYRMAYILSKAQGAVDWFNGAPLGTTYGKYYRIHNHHIFPASLLYDTDNYDSDSHLHRKIVNEIANRAFLTADTNWEIANRPPDEYLPEVEKNYPGALVKQFVPVNPVLWKIENVDAFLNARRELIARKINEFMDALIAEPEVPHKRPIVDLIALGESSTLEFKSTLQWDVVLDAPNKELRHSVLKTIAAFLNSEGGTLVIGVEDDGGLHGLEKDLSTVDGSRDKYEQLLVSLLQANIGGQYAHLVKIRFEEVGDKQVCVIDVDQASEPVFLKDPKNKNNSLFFVRFGNTTRSLSPEEIASHVLMKMN